MILVHTLSKSQVAGYGPQNFFCEEFEQVNLYHSSQWYSWCGPPDISGFQQGRVLPYSIHLYLFVLVSCLRVARADLLGKPPLGGELPQCRWLDVAHLRTDNPPSLQSIALTVSPGSHEPTAKPY